MKKREIKGRLPAGCTTWYTEQQDGKGRAEILIRTGGWLAGWRTANGGWREDHNWIATPDVEAGMFPRRRLSCPNWPSLPVALGKIAKIVYHGRSGNRAYIPNMVRSPSPRTKKGKQGRREAQ